VTKSWSHLNSKATAIANALAVHDVRSLKSLRKAWTQTPDYLLSEYLEWLPNELHNEVRLNWPGLQFKTDS